jgi:hypothetical protein
MNSFAMAFMPWKKIKYQQKALAINYRILMAKANFFVQHCYHGINAVAKRMILFSRWYLKV